MDRKKPSVPSDDRAKETSEVRNKRKSMTCPEEEAYVDMLRTTDLLSRGLALRSDCIVLTVDFFILLRPCCWNQSACVLKRVLIGFSL